MIRQHLPALQVIVPLLAAPLCVVINRPRFAWLLSLVASWATLGIALATLAQVLSEIGRAHV